MERVVKISFIIFSLLCFCPFPSFGAEFPNVEVVQEIKQPEPSDCIETFSIPYDKLYYLTLAATNEFNYQIREIQTKNGYIIFETGYRKYLASIVYVSSGKSMLKITPYSGNYDFPIAVPQSVFKYIEQNKDKTY